MKFKIFILITFFSLDTFAQCCCGEFYFRIYDPAGIIYPAINDTLGMNIQKNATDIGSGRPIDGKKLPFTNLFIKTIKSKGNTGTASIGLVKFPFTNLLFNFNTGCHTQLKKISVAKGKKKMTLNLVDIPSETTILMDSIPFVEGEFTYNIGKIIRDNEACTYENLPGNKFYLHYRIPYNLLEISPLTKSWELKNDTMYYYTDTLKTKILAKGKVKVRKKNVRFYSALDMEMQTQKRVFYLKRGTWQYFYKNSELRKKENQKPYKPRKPKNGYRHVRLEETGF